MKLPALVVFWIFLMIAFVPLTQSSGFAADTSPAGMPDIRDNMENVGGNTSFTALDVATTSPTVGNYYVMVATGIKSTGSGIGVNGSLQTFNNNVTDPELEIGKGRTDIEEQCVRVWHLENQGDYAVTLDNVGNQYYLRNANPLDQIKWNYIEFDFGSGNVATSPGEIRGVGANGQFFAVNVNGYGVQVYNAMATSSPMGKGNVTGPAGGVGVVNTTVLAAAGSSVFAIDCSNTSDISDGVSCFSKSGGTANEILIVDDLAYVCWGGGGLSILNVSDPTANPLPELGSIPASDQIVDVAISDTLLYIADGTAGIHCYDVSNPMMPSKVITQPVSGKALGVSVSRDHVYVAADTSGLQVFEKATYNMELTVTPQSVTYPTGATVSAMVDAGGSPISGVDVELTHDSHYPIIESMDGSTGIDGKFTVQAKCPGINVQTNITFTARFYMGGSLIGTKTATWTVNPDPSGLLLDIGFSAEPATSGGLVDVTVTLTDQGNPMEGATVSFGDEGSGGSFNPSSVITGPDGKNTTTYRSKKMNQPFNATIECTVNAPGYEIQKFNRSIYMILPVLYPQAMLDRDTMGAGEEAEMTLWIPDPLNPDNNISSPKVNLSTDPPGGKFEEIPSGITGVLKYNFFAPAVYQTTTVSIIMSSLSGSSLGYKDGSTIFEVEVTPSEIDAEVILGKSEGYSYDSMLITVKIRMLGVFIEGATVTATNSEGDTFHFEPGDPGYYISSYKLPEVDEKITVTFTIMITDIPGYSGAPLTEYGEIDVLPPPPESPKIVIEHTDYPDEENGFTPNSKVEYLVQVLSNRQDNPPIANAKVTLEISNDTGSKVNIDVKEMTTNESGYAVFTFTVPDIESFQETFEANFTISGKFLLTTTKIVTFTVAESEDVIRPLINSGGIKDIPVGSAKPIWITIKDGEDGIEGVEVELTLDPDLGRISPSSGTTDENGKFTAMYYPPEETDVSTKVTINAEATKDGYTFNLNNQTFNIIPSGSTGEVSEDDDSSALAIVLIVVVVVAIVIVFLLMYMKQKKVYDKYMKENQKTPADAGAQPPGGPGLPPDQQPVDPGNPPQYPDVPGVPPAQDQGAPGAPPPQYPGGPGVPPAQDQGAPGAPPPQYPGGPGVPPAQDQGAPGATPPQYPGGPGVPPAQDQGAPGAPNMPMGQRPPANPPRQ